MSDHELQTSDFKEYAVFAVAEKNKKTRSKSEQLKLVSLDKGFFGNAHSTDYTYYRVDITASSARFGLVKYSAVISNVLSGLLALEDFERR
ncbi:unnamed protein product [Linum trigynum]|uniref:Uncharacterized protein n=1 Tax=Linum trigynum TaxID=586398 RepID=A0AAV2EJQ3_9ROSI